MDIIINELLEGATLQEVVSKVKEIRDANETIRLALLQLLLDNNVEVNEASTLQVLVSKLNELFEDKSPVPDIFDSEPGNPFGDSLYSKIRYRDKDGKDRVVYSKKVSNDYPCFNPATNILYFATKATYVQGYVYENNKWNTIAEAYFGYLPSGIELESVYSNSVDIGYHSTHANYGKVWKAKTDY
jgi:hypothetical protein